jgi:hypothetical protein
MDREEALWDRPENAQYYDFYMFWEEYHYGEDDYHHDDYHHDDYHHDDYNDYQDCDWKEWRGQCNDFSYMADEVCDWYISYSPCVFDHFICEASSTNEYGEVELYDCTVDFLDEQHWAMDREEALWDRPENAQYYDFFQFWEEYHYGEDDCEWKDVSAECSDFDFLAGDECLI